MTCQSLMAPRMAAIAGSDPGHIRPSSGSCNEFAIAPNDAACANLAAGGLVSDQNQRVCEGLMHRDTLAAAAAGGRGNLIFFPRRKEGNSATWCSPKSPFWRFSKLI